MMKIQTLAFCSISCLLTASGVQADPVTAAAMPSAQDIAATTQSPAQVGVAAKAPSGQMELSDVVNPPTEIATADVVDDKGNAVGAVQKVVLGGDNRPKKVDVSLMGTDQIIAMQASSLTYDRSRNVLTAQLDRSQIVQMPQAGQ